MNETHYDSMLTGKERDISCRRCNGFVDGVGIVIAKLGGPAGADIIVTPADARAFAADILATADKVDGGKPQPETHEQDAMRELLDLLARLDIISLREDMDKLGKRVGAIDDIVAQAIEMCRKSEDETHKRIHALEADILPRPAALEGKAQAGDKQDDTLRCPLCGERIEVRYASSVMWEVSDNNGNCTFPCFEIFGWDEADAKRKAAAILGQVKP